LRFSQASGKNEQWFNPMFGLFLLYKNTEGGLRDSLDIDLRAGGNFRRRQLLSITPIRIKIEKKKSSETPLEVHKNWSWYALAERFEECSEYNRQRIPAYKCNEEVNTLFFPNTDGQDCPSSMRMIKKGGKEFLVLDRGWWLVSGRSWRWDSLMKKSLVLHFEWILRLWDMIFFNYISGIQMVEHVYHNQRSWSYPITELYR